MLSEPTARPLKKHVPTSSPFIILADPKLLELGLLDNPDAYKAEYYKYMLNGLMTQLMRIEPGKDIEEAHMRNRALIAYWVLDHGKADRVVELIKRDGKTYVQINDYTALRGLFAKLLAEIQRIKSEGDFAAGRTLVETYGVKVDQELHKEVLDRYSHLDIAPYKASSTRFTSSKRIITVTSST